MSTAQESQLLPEGNVTMISPFGECCESEGSEEGDGNGESEENIIAAIQIWSLTCSRWNFNSRPADC